jgi:hypothetical protein
MDSTEKEVVMRRFASPAMLLLIAAAPASQNAPNPAKPICQNAGLLNATDPKPKAGIHPLGEEPPARQVIAVLKTVDGCSRPVVVRENIGPSDSYIIPQRSSTKRP